MSFFNQLENSVNNNPEKTAIRFVDEPNVKITYGELNVGILQTEGYLKSLGVKVGDRIAVQLPKCPEFIYLYLAIIRMGAIALPLNPAYPIEELKYFLEDSETSLFFTDILNNQTYSTLVDDLPNLKKCVFIDSSNLESFTNSIKNFPIKIIPNQWNEDDRTAVIIYTSGTTGRPKGAQITQRNLNSNLEALHEAWGWREDDILFHVLPIFHVHGLFVALKGALYSGSTAILIRKFNAEKTLEGIIDYECTVFMGVPTIHSRLLSAKNSEKINLSHLRLMTSGSDRLPDEVFSKYQTTFGQTLLERYGMTETSMNLSNPLDGERKIGSVGFPLPGVEARIVDLETSKVVTNNQIGEVQLRGPNVFKGYWKQEKKTDESFTSDGWFHTGDLGYQAEDGYYYLQGRSKDLIISGGMNIYPPEVERILAEHPSVVASAVIGCNDPEWGEKIVAVIVTNKEVSKVELISFCQAKLASYKVAKEIYFQDSLPRNALGKIQKEKLRKLYCK